MLGRAVRIRASAICHAAHAKVTAQVPVTCAQAAPCPLSSGSGSGSCAGGHTGQQPIPACSATPCQPPPLAPDASPTHQRLHNELLHKGFSTFRFVRVPQDYYDKPLEYRQVRQCACTAARLRISQDQL